MSGRGEWLEKQQGVWTHGFERIFNEVIEDVDKELKRKDETHGKELNTKGEQHQILSGRYHEEIIKNAHLVEENSRLKRRLEKLDQGKTPAPVSTSASGDGRLQIKPQVDYGATVLADEYQHLAEKFNDLHKKHQEAIQRLKYTERKNVAVMQKNREMKETVLAWQKFSDRQQAKTQRAKSEAKSTIESSEVMVSGNGDKPPLLPSSSGSSILQTPRSLVGLDRSSPAPMTLLAQVQNASTDAPGDDAEANVPGTTLDQIEKDDRQVETIPNHSLEPQHLDLQGVAVEDMLQDLAGPYHTQEKIASSQTTEDELIAQSSRWEAGPVAATIDDDFPQFISEKSLKRKRPSGAKFDIYADPVPSDGTVKRPVQVKDEPLSSPPISTTTHQLLRKETLDLDELGPHPISTPHRRIRRSYAATTGVLRHQRSISVPLVKEEDENQTASRAFVVQQVRQRTPSIRDLLAGEARANSEPFERFRQGVEPLRAMDPNMQPPARPDVARPTKRQKKDGAALSVKYQMLTESGEEPLPVIGDDLRLAPNAARSNFNRRLKDGPDIVSPSVTTKSPIASLKRRNAEQVPTPPSSASKAMYTPSTRPGPRKISPPETNPKLKARDRPSSRAAGPATRGTGKAKQPDTEPLLRSKAVSELKLSDFKPNPAYNQGYSYAFAETVRKRGDRACLTGCTRPECCGSTFRTLAAAAAPLSSTQEETLLEDYLGDAYDTMCLTQMSQEERQELILQARTREMANKHGRHRQAYERHKSPPGFWRMDFPDTQELEEDRQKAVEMEQAMIQERRAEAMRKGGRWIFKDE
ncbi:SAE2-domain-containing protein [Lophiostoma macrostomum CBS 122681]|uniref:SAE2-domain-containing protein n=1 Tax=Lophiostoma macrostomum CBS 122681 TaxID=1314788 RepID=A0A6A6TNP3_9PLEO|nr:SAE2-domain-containing protein [Lophiostoma macrostomum CBS 122681]